jgi:hypothetical protein
MHMLTGSEVKQRDNADRVPDRMTSIAAYTVLSIGVLAFQFSIYQLLQFMGS